MARWSSARLCLLNAAVGTNACPAWEVLKDNLKHHCNHEPKDLTNIWSPLRAKARAISQQPFPSRGEANHRQGLAAPSPRTWAVNTLCC